MSCLWLRAVPFFGDLLSLSQCRTLHGQVCALSGLQSSRSQRPVCELVWLYSLAHRLLPDEQRTKFEGPQARLAGRALYYPVHRW